MTWMIQTFLVLLLSNTLASAAMIKNPNVAGQFYSDNPNELSAHVDYFKEQAKDVPLDRRVEMVIAPHAGYAFSGPVAGFAFKALARNHYSTVVVIAPSHFFPFQGIALWPEGEFKTPIGSLGVDAQFTEKLLQANPQFKQMPNVFEREHALEVELPFLLKTLGAVKIVPILMGQPDFRVCESLAEALHQIIGKRDDVLVLISSDLSHYHDYQTANAMDARTLKTVSTINPQELFKGCLSGDMEMCGFVPATTGLLYAQKQGIKYAEILKYANSGDTTGDQSRVVGYGAVIFYSDLVQTPVDLRDQADLLSVSQGKQLVSTARASLEHFVRLGKVEQINESDPRLNQVAGAFVTLKKAGQLRGCIGQIIGQGPLISTVRDMAIAAATKDTRFAPVGVGELKDISLEVSVLSAPRRIKDASEIVLGRHGVIISDGHGHQGVFLPQVADEFGWNKEEFLNQLCVAKAGLATDAWRNPNVELYVFTSQVFEE